jgi:hypothetical protein
LACHAAIKEARMFFFEKKNQKTFASKLLPRSRPSCIFPQAPGIKVFLLLFLQKKKILFYSLLAKIRQDAVACA